MGPRRICDIYDFFAPRINALTYLLTYTYYIIFGRPPRGEASPFPPGGATGYTVFICYQSLRQNRAPYLHPALKMHTIWNGVAVFCGCEGNCRSGSAQVMRQTWIEIRRLLQFLWTVSKEISKSYTLMGHFQGCSSLHDPSGRAKSLGRPQLVGYC